LVAGPIQRQVELGNKNVADSVEALRTRVIKSLRARRAQSRGFTLLELVLVMLFMCIFAAMVSPSLRGFWAGARMKNAATEIITLMNYAHSQAVAESVLYRLNIDTGNGRCFLTRLNGTNLEALGNYLDAGVLMPEQTRLEMKRADGLGNDYIDFFPDGRINPAQLRLIDTDEDVIVIQSKAPAEMFRILTREETLK
jgi:type II secretion system protein H